MAVEILGAVVIGRLGRPLRLRVWLDSSRNGDCMNPAPDKLPRADSREALAWAQLYVSCVLGWPSNRTINWEPTRADYPDLAPPPLVGPSLFGMFTLAFLRSVALDAPDAVKPARREAALCIANTRMECVAVSAAFDRCSGCFLDVGNIELKLMALTRLGPQTCKLCIVSTAQPIALKKVTETPQYTTYRLPNDQQSVAVVTALDPLDAMKRIFTLQAASGLTC